MLNAGVMSEDMEEIKVVRTRNFTKNHNNYIGILLKMSWSGRLGVNVEELNNWDLMVTHDKE